MKEETIPLFQEYSLFSERIPRVKLGEFPTPVKRMENAGRELGLRKLYIKRDDLSGKPYGGNKVRKLEFLLADALAAGKREIYTFGAAGSNHALATAVYAKKLNMECSLYLVPQPNAQYVRKNLLMDLAAGAVINFVPTRFYAWGYSWFNRLRDRFQRGVDPYGIPFGGTTPLSTTGFVNAAFELKVQVEQGKLPEPDYIYIPLGSMGTAVGLMLGLKACGLKSRVVAVRVVPLELANESSVIKLFHETSTFLNRQDGSFPRYELPADQLDLRHNFFGTHYARYTEEGVRAMDMLQQKEGITLEGTYTGKAFAALVDDAGSGRLKDKTVLFWNTYNSRDFSAQIKDVDYRRLPAQLQRYFVENYQSLDRRAASN